MTDHCHQSCRPMSSPERDAWLREMNVEIDAMRRLKDDAPPRQGRLSKLLRRFRPLNHAIDWLRR
jgi:hypothetical protein